jgi:hypothetical protein
VKAGLGLALAVALAACSMVSSGLLDEDPHKPLACRSQAGAYYLSKTFLEISIVEDIEAGRAAGVPVYRIQAVSDVNKDNQSGGGLKPVIHPDSRHPFCLDYLAMPTSNDTVLIQKNQQLLERITTNADDQSAKIAENIIKTLFAGLSNNADFNQTLRSGGAALGTGSIVPRFNGEFDPFDKVETAKLNHALKDFGFCILVQYDGAPVDPAGHDVQHYCDEPLSYFHAKTARPRGARNANEYSDDVHAYLEAPDRHQRTHDGPRPYTDGIFYRPRLPHSVFLFTKKNPKAREGWRLVGSETALFENRSPVVRVAVDRTFFALRKTTLYFDQGVLRDIEIKKDSELAGFVAIPLQIAQSVAALPANIIQVKIKQTNKYNELIKARSELIAAETQLAVLEKERRRVDPTGSLSNVPLRSSGPDRSSGGGWTTTPTAAGANPAGGVPPLNVLDPAQRSVAVIGGEQCIDQCRATGRGPVQCGKYCNCLQTACRFGSADSCRQACWRENE